MTPTSCSTRSRAIQRSKTRPSARRTSSPPGTWRSRSRSSRSSTSKATRDSRPDPLTHKQAVKLVESLLRFPVAAITTGLMLAALATRERFGISYWDAAILEAGRSLGCDVVLSGVRTPPSSPQRRARLRGSPRRSRRRRRRARESRRGSRVPEDERWTPGGAPPPRSARPGSPDRR